MANFLINAIKLNAGPLKWHKIYFSNGTMIRKYDSIEALKNQYSEAQEIKEI